MTQVQIESQIWEIGPLLTHSLMVTGQLSLSLCLLCLKFFKFDLFIRKTSLPFLAPYRNVPFKSSLDQLIVFFSLSVLQIPWKKSILICCKTSLLFGSCRDLSRTHLLWGWLEEREVDTALFIQWVLACHTPPPFPPNTLLFIDGGSCHSHAITKGWLLVCLPLHRNHWAILH